MRIQSTCAVVLLCAVASPADGATYHVAQRMPAASDRNLGTLERPWATLGKACEELKPGDVLLIHAGHYRECARVKRPGLPGTPILLKAFEDDEVVIDGADVVAAERWTPARGARQVYETDCPRDPGQIFIDGKPVYMKVKQLKGKRWELGKLTDADANLWQYDGARKKLLLNVGGGNPGEKHKVEIPLRPHGVVLRDDCRVRGIHVTRTASVGIECSADRGVADTSGVCVEAAGQVNA